MRIIILLLIISFASPCFADVVLHRYYDTVTNEEMGICYSSKDGTPAHNRPDWTIEVINESEKQYYIKEHQKQLKAKAKAKKDELKAKRKIIKDKLKAGTPLSQQDCDILVGD